jgi:hypothetical protein
VQAVTLILESLPKGNGLICCKKKAAHFQGGMCLLFQ